MSDISNSEDYLDVRDIIARVEELRDERKPWVAGWNMPSHMPDAEPATFATWSDARDYISEELRRDDESMDNAQACDAAEALDNLGDEHNAAWGINAGQFYWWIEPSENDGLDDDDRAELNMLESLLDDMKGMGGDEQWNGDWYPVTLIRDSYFEDAMDDLLADCYDLDALKVPSFVKLTIDYDALQMDYSSVEYDGVIYWYR